MSYNLIGGKGGSGTFKTAPDTLRSNDSFEMLVGLGSGRWKGLKEGLKSLEINNVPLENSDGSSNFEDFTVFFADGDPAQAQQVSFKLGGGGGTTTVNTPIGNSNNSGPGPWVTAVVATPNADFLDVRLIISSLYVQDKKGIRETAMTLEVEMRPSGTDNWINPLLSNNAPTYNQDGFDVDDGFGSVIKTLIAQNRWASENTWNDSNPGFIKITDKTTSAAVKELRIAVPNTGAYANKTWELRVRLVEKDLVQGADSYEERRDIQFESIAAITKTTFGITEAWRGVAWLQVVGKATDQLSGVPSMRGIYNTKIVKVPTSSVYNPSTRQYTGTIWNGSYDLQYCNDPAWCIKDLIEDPISGIAAMSPGATLDKWDALEASKYFSQLVPDGKGGTHPRFSMNIKIDQAQKAEDLMSFLAGAVNSICHDVGDGKWRLKVDKPESAVAVFTRDNIFGEFAYQHTDVDTRFNDYTVTFLNKDSKYVEDRVRVYDQTHIDTFGRKPTTIVAYGADNRQEALRRGMYRLRVSTNETKLVNFTTNRQGSLIRPLDIILVADTDLAYVGDPTDSGNRTTTRLANRSGTTLNLGSKIRLETGVTYQIAVTVPNPAYNPDTLTQPGSAEWTKPTITVVRDVVNNSSQRGDVDTLYINTALPANTPANAPIALSAAGLPSLPVAYRVMEITGEEDKISISALIIDTGKWAAADNVTEEAIVGQISDTTVPPPEVPDSGMFDIRTFVSDFQTKRVLTITWDRPGSLFLDGFRVEYNLNNGPWRVLAERTQTSYIELQQPQAGTYNFRISSVDRRGRQSAPLLRSFVVDDTPQDYAPRNQMGHLVDRPAAGELEGERYTTDDQSPNVTYVWHDGQWVEESNLVVDATQIYYVDPTGGPATVPVQDLMPAGPGATAGAPPGTTVNGRPVEEITDDLDLNGQSWFDLSYLTSTRDAIMLARTTLDGQQIGVVVQNAINQQVTDQSATVENFNLLGAKSGDGQAWNLNLTTVRVSPTESLGQRLNTIDVTLGEQHGSITDLQEVVIGPDGTTARALLSLDVNGKVAGMIATNNGVVSSLELLFDSFNLLTPTGGSIFYAEGDTVKMPNVEVDTLTVNTAVTPVRVSATSSLTGSWGSTADVPASSTISHMSVAIEMTVPGWIEVTITAKQRFNDPNTPHGWAGAIDVDGTLLPEAYAFGQYPQDSLPLSGSFYADTPGTYTINFRWQAHSSIQLQNRSMFAKGFPYTE